MPIAPPLPTEQCATGVHSLAVVRATPAPRVESEEVAEAGSALFAQQVLHGLRRTWLIAIPLATIAAGIVYLVAESRLTPLYTARTMLHVGADNPGLLYDNITGRPDTSNFQRTQIATVKSRLVRQTAVRTLEPLALKTLTTKDDPLGWMEKELQADFTVAPEILRITMKGSEPDELIVILNTVRDTYLREIVNKDRSYRESRLEELRQLASKYEGVLKSQRGHMTARAEAHGVRGLPALRGNYEYLQGRIYALQNDLLLARLELESAEAVPSPEVKDKLLPNPAAVESALERAVATDLESGKLRQDIERLEKKREELRRRLLSYMDDADYKLVGNELATRQRALADRRKALRLIVEEELRTGQPVLKPVVPAGPRWSTPVLKQQIALLEAEIKKKMEEADTIARGVEELDVLKAEYNSQEAQLHLVKDKMRPFEVELQTAPRAGVIEEAVITETPKWDHALKRAVAPAGVAFFGVLALVIWLDLRRGRVNGSADLEAARIRVIGAVPAVNSNVLPAFAPPVQGRANQEYLRLTDAMEMTRAVISPILARAHGYTLVVTSAAAGEGKTVVSAHLAARFARSGVRTLLIDTDVRRPKLDQLFGMESGPGFGEWVTGEAGLTQIALPGPVPGLDIIVAGRCDARLVAEQIDLRFPELLDAARQEYDVIVLDTAPLLCCPETLALSRMADGVVLSVMRDVSRISGVQACTERLASINTEVLGAVVTGDSPARYASY